MIFLYLSFLSFLLSFFLRFLFFFLSSPYMFIYLFFPHGLIALEGPGLLIIEASRSFSFKHTAVGRTPLDEWSARSRDHYRTIHNTHKIQTSTFPAGFELAIPASERPETHALIRSATGTVICLFCNILFSKHQVILLVSFHGYGKWWLLLANQNSAWVLLIPCVNSELFWFRCKF
jgi:hypothetical protein